MRLNKKTPFMFEKVKVVVSLSNYAKLSSNPICPVCLTWFLMDDGLGEESLEPLLPIPKCSLPRILRFLDVLP